MPIIKKKVPFVVIIGGDEMQSGLLTLKNMTSGEQEKLTIDQIREAENKFNR